MNWATVIPAVESLLPYLKTIVENNISNAVEKAALLGFIDLCKNVADAYVASQAAAPVVPPQA